MPQKTKPTKAFKDQVEQILETEVRPGLMMDGGNIDLVSVDEKTGDVQVKLQGHCACCPMSQITLHNWVEKTLKAKVSKVKSVTAV